MSSNFTMTIQGKKITATLLDKVAPNICKNMREHLPLESLGVHAKFAGDESIVMVPFYTEPENEIFHVEAGDIGYYPGRQTICIFYGKTKPFGKVSVFARIHEGLKEMEEVSKEILKKGYLPVHIRLEEE